MDFCIEESTVILYEFVRIGEDENALIEELNSKFNVEETPEEKDQYSHSLMGVHQPSYSVTKWNTPKDWKKNEFEELFVSLIEFDDISGFKTIALIGKLSDGALKALNSKEVSLKDFKQGLNLHWEKLPVDEYSIKNERIRSIFPLELSTAKVEVDDLSDIEKNFPSDVRNKRSIKKGLDNLRDDEDFLEKFGINSANSLSAITPLPLTIIGETNILSIGNRKTFKGIGLVEISSQDFSSKDFHLEVPLSKSSLFYRIWMLESFYILLWMKSTEIREFEDKVDGLQLNINNIEDKNISNEIEETLKAKNRFFNNYIEFKRLESDVNNFLTKEEARKKDLNLESEIASAVPNLVDRKNGQKIERKFLEGHRNKIEILSEQNANDFSDLEEQYQILSEHLSQNSNLNLQMESLNLQEDTKKFSRRGLLLSAALVFFGLVQLITNEKVTSLFNSVNIETLLDAFLTALLIL